MKRHKAAETTSTHVPPGITDRTLQKSPPTQHATQLLLALVSVHIHVVPAGTIRIPAFPLISSMPQPFSSFENLQHSSWNRLTAYTGSGIVCHLPLSFPPFLLPALSVLISSLAFFL